MLRVWDADGMRIDRRLTLLGVLLVVLSTVMATQYATTRVGFTYSIVHPSNADIRFVGCDNSSDDGDRVLRVNGTNGTNAKLKIELGDWSANMNKTYAAAFAIVNEEHFALNITHVTVTNTSGTWDYMQIWLHGDGSVKATDDPTAVFLYNNGTSAYSASTTAWTLGRGDGDTTTMTTNLSTLSNSDTNLSTIWDTVSNVRYCEDIGGTNQTAMQVGYNGRTVENASDYVWVQISLNIPENGPVGDDHGGTVHFHFKADTHWGED